MNLPRLIFAASLACLIAWAVTSMLVPAVIEVARALRAMDYPGGRKRHSAATPRLGGVAVVAGIALASAAVAAITWGQWGKRVDAPDVAGFAVATLLIALVGLVDDVFGLSFYTKFALEVAGAAIVVAMGWRFKVLALPFIGDVRLGALGVVLSVVWVVGVTNAINLIDGLDGLAGGVVALIAGSLMVFAALQANRFTVVLLAAVVGACVAFLRHNWNGRIFLGDTGSLTLGFLLGAASVHSSLKAPAAVAILVPVLALGVPVIDTLLVMVVRFLERPKGRLAERVLAMFSADRNHLHHVLQAWAGRRRRVVVVIYVLVGLGGAAALVVALTKNATLAALLVCVEALTVVAVRQIGMAARARAQASAGREELRRRISASGEHEVVRLRDGTMRVVTMPRPERWDEEE